jgi:hypothetical protein
MRTMDEVLEKMYEETSTAIARDERDYFITRIKRGQIYDFQKKPSQALDLWCEVLESVVSRVISKQEEVRELDVATGSETASDISNMHDDGENDIEEIRRTKKLQALRTKRGNELRDLLDLQHRVTFMMASANFQLKNEDEETRLYEDAERLRQEVNTIANCFDR